MLKITHLWQILTSKAHLPLLLALTIFMVVDVITRINMTIMPQSKPWRDENTTKVMIEKITATQTAMISDAINHYKIEKNSDIARVATLLSTAEQNAQQGDLEQLFSGDMRYRLMGVFKEKHAFAAIQQKNLLSEEEKTIKVTLSSSLNNYQVDDISANKVTFSSQQGLQVALYLYNKTQQK